MPTPIAACGAECGIAGVNTLHYNAGGTGTRSFDTTTFRTGTRSRRYNPTAAQSVDGLEHLINTATRIIVFRGSIRFATLPSNDSTLVAVERFAGNCEGLAFQASDSTLRPFVNVDGGAITFGSNGFTVTTGVWYDIDMKVDCSVNPRTVDIRVNETALNQLTKATAAQNLDFFAIGACTSAGPNNVTADLYWDDWVISQTSGDYPLGPLIVARHLPNRDGTHNVTAGNFTYSGATELSGATDSWQNLDDVPLPLSTGSSDRIEQLLNAATEYSEHGFEPSTYGAPVGGVEVILARSEAGTGTCVYQIRMRDTTNNTEDTILNHNAAGATSPRYVRKFYATLPGGAVAWTADLLDTLRVRFGFSSDANPDVHFEAIMLEVPYLVSEPSKPNLVSQMAAQANW